MCQRFGMREEITMTPNTLPFLDFEKLCNHPVREFVVFKQPLWIHNASNDITRQKNAR